jgi:hypothetical protein
VPRTGRPTKLTPALTAAYCGRVAAGLSRTRAAAAVGISKKTLFAWLRAGRYGRSRPHAQFRAAVLTAEAQFVAGRLAAVVRTGTPHRTRTTRTTTFPDGRVVVEVTERVAFDWRAAAWLLRTKDTDEFGNERGAELAALRREVADLRRLLAAGRGEHAG